jgi:hypothetical protein
MNLYRCFLEKVEAKLEKFEQKLEPTAYWPVVTYFTSPLLIAKGLIQTIFGALMGAFFELKHLIDKNDDLSLQRSLFYLNNAVRGLKCCSKTLGHIALTTFNTTFFPLLLIHFDLVNLSMQKAQPSLK